MTGRDRFTDAEWRSLVSAPGAASVAVVAMNHFGLIRMIKELRGAEKALKAAQSQDGRSEVVDEMIACLDDHAEELSPSASTDDPDGTLEGSLESLSIAGQVAERLTAEELDAYVDWVVGVATGAAKATREKGSDSVVSTAERELLEAIEARIRRV